MPACRREAATPTETFTRYESRTRQWLERARQHARETGRAFLLRDIHEEAPQSYRIVPSEALIPPHHEIVLGILMHERDGLLEFPGPSVRRWSGQTVILPPPNERFIADINRREQEQDEESAEAELAEEPDVEGAGEFAAGDLLPPYIPIVLPEYSDEVDPPPAYARGSLARTGDGDDRGKGPFRIKTAYTFGMQEIHNRRNRYGDEWFRNYCLKMSDRALLIHEHALRQEDAMEFTDNMDTGHHRRAAQRAECQRQVFAETIQTSGTERDNSAQTPTTNVPQIPIRDFQVPPTRDVQVIPTTDIPETLIRDFQAYNDQVISTSNDEATPTSNDQVTPSSNVWAPPTRNVPGPSTIIVLMTRWVLQDRLVFGSGNESPDVESDTDSDGEFAARARRAQAPTSSRATRPSRMNRLRNQFSRVRLRR